MPQTPKVGVNMQFQSKIPQSKIRTISEIINPIKPKFEGKVSTITDGRHLENGMTS